MLQVQLVCVVAGVAVTLCGGRWSGGGGSNPMLWQVVAVTLCCGRWSGGGGSNPMLWQVVGGWWQ